MALADALRRHPDELRADFQQYYTLNVDDMGGAYSYGHAAALVAQLPPSSRTFRAERPELAWGDAEALLSSIEYSLRVLCWRETKDGQRGRRPPKPVTPPGGGASASRVRATDTAYIDRVLRGGAGG